MATVKLESIAKARDYTEIVANLNTFVGTLDALDTVYSFQIIKVAEDPEFYWGCIVIWNDNA